MLVEYLPFWTSGICIGYHVRAQLFSSAKWGSRQRTDSFPLWSRILDGIPVALPVLFPVTLPVKLPALHPVAIPVLLPVALPVLLQAALPVVLPVALPVIISNFNILKVGELIEFLFYVLLPFVNLAFVKLAVWKTVHSFLACKIASNLHFCHVGNQFESLKM